MKNYPVLSSSRNSPNFAFYATRRFVTAFTRARHLLCLYRKQSKLVNVYVAKAYGRVKVKVKVKLEAFLDSY